MASHTGPVKPINIRNADEPLLIMHVGADCRAKGVIRAKVATALKLLFLRFIIPPPSFSRQSKVINEKVICRTKNVLSADTGKEIQTIPPRRTGGLNGSHNFIVLAYKPDGLPNKEIGMP